MRGFLFFSFLSILLEGRKDLMPSIVLQGERPVKGHASVKEGVLKR
jgi:hypothetical protein